MNSSQRRKHLRPLKKEWLGKKVKVKVGYAAGLTATVTDIGFGFHPVHIHLDTGVPVRGSQIVYDFCMDFNNIEKVT